MTTTVFNVTGMHCSSASMLITMNLNDHDGVQDTKCDHVTGRTDVTYDPSRVPPDQIVSEIVSAGYGAERVR